MSLIHSSFFFNFKKSEMSTSSGRCYTNMVMVLGNHTLTLRHPASLGGLCRRGVKSINNVSTEQARQLVCSHLDLQEEGKCKRPSPALPHNLGHTAQSRVLKPSPAVSSPSNSPHLHSAPLIRDLSSSVSTASTSSCTWVSDGPGRHLNPGKYVTSFMLVTSDLNRTELSPSLIQSYPPLNCILGLSICHLFSGINRCH